MYRTLNDHYRETFGCKVYKLALEGGFTCPNRDGTLGTGGCIFCDAEGGGSFAQAGCHDIQKQLQQAKARVESKNPGGRYIAYFQSFTGTYGPVEVLEQRFTAALEQPEILGLAIGTRPDCLPPQVMELLTRLNRRKPVSVELGLQTVHEATARYIRRGYETAVYFEAVRKLKAAGIETVTHIILGLPGETEDMMVQTTRQAIQAGTDGVKFHLLHVLRGTDLERDYLAGKFSCMTMESYAHALKRCLGELKPETVVHRITGDGAKRNLVAPLWSADKKRVLQYLQAYLAEP